MMRALVYDQFSSLICSTRADHLHSGSASQLRRSHTHSAARTMNQHALARKRLRFLKERAIRRGIGDADRRTLREGDTFGQRMHLRFIAERQFRVRAADASGDVDTTANLYRLDPMAHGLDHSR